MQTCTCQNCPKFGQFLVWDMKYRWKLEIDVKRSEARETVGNVTNALYCFILGQQSNHPWIIIFNKISIRKIQWCYIFIPIDWILVKLGPIAPQSYTTCSFSCFMNVIFIEVFELRMKLAQSGNILWMPLRKEASFINTKQWYNIISKPFCFMCFYFWCCTYSYFCWFVPMVSHFVSIILLVLLCFCIFIMVICRFVGFDCNKET